MASGTAHPRPRGPRPPPSATAHAPPATARRPAPAAPGAPPRRGRRDQSHTLNAPAAIRSAIRRGHVGQGTRKKAPILHSGLEPFKSLKCVKHHRLSMANLKVTGVVRNTSNGRSEPRVQGEQRRFEYHQRRAHSSSTCRHAAAGPGQGPGPTRLIGNARALWATRPRSPTRPRKAPRSGTYFTGKASALCRCYTVRAGGLSTCPACPIERSLQLPSAPFSTGNKSEKFCKVCFLNSSAQF